MTDKEIEELGRQEYAKWRANQNKLNLLKGIIDETSNDRLSQFSLCNLATS